MPVLRQILESLRIPFDAFGRKAEVSFERVASLDEAGPGALVFVHRPGAQTAALLSGMRAAAVLVPAGWAQQNAAQLDGLEAAVVAVESPRWVAARVQASLQPDDEAWGEGVHPTALVAPGAELAPDVVVGPYSVLGRCRIGAGTRIGAFCRIHDVATLGRRVRVRDHASIGGVGFGVERGPDGSLARFPHHGTVQIEDGVEMFPFVNVDRGTFGPTRVGEGTFLDHYVHIGHNSLVGKHCIITAQVVLCGKSVVEDRAWLGVGSVIREGRRVGADATVGLGTVVIRDVPAGSTVAGVPAREVRSGGGT